MNIWVGIPAMNELDSLPNTLLSLEEQSLKGYKVVICVNQPQSYIDDPHKRFIYDNNQELISLLKNFHNLDLTILDNSSKQNSWVGKKHGVGMARKVIMDYIGSQAEPEDIIVSLDADTTLEKNYLSEVKNQFTKYPKAVALASPYYHRLISDSESEESKQEVGKLNKSSLHYEIYMRCYLLNLFRINSPYAFTALGSSLAVRVKDCLKIGGMTPKLSGEDFYFLQKLKKCGSLLINLPSMVYPLARYSDRVFFGTGPALIKGSSGDWDSYPIYHHELFDIIADSYAKFPQIYNNLAASTPLDRFLNKIFKEESWFLPLKANNKRVESFIKACHEKFDGLRILQYLKEENDQSTMKDTKKLALFFEKFHPEFETTRLNEVDKLDDLTVRELDQIRNFLFKLELEQRNKIKLLS